MVDEQLMNTNLCATVWKLAERARDRSVFSQVIVTLYTVEAL